LVPLTDAVYFFNNTGDVLSYNPTTGAWLTGIPISNVAGFKALQDTSVSTYNSASNTLLATSDGSRRAYLSFDYSNKTFIKFNEVDKTFTSLPQRPTGEQWLMTTY
jgi:hypothetical protein